MRMTSSKKTGSERDRLEILNRASVTGDPSKLRQLYSGNLSDEIIRSGKESISDQHDIGARKMLLYLSIAPTAGFGDKKIPNLNLSKRIICDHPELTKRAPVNGDSLSCVTPGGLEPSTN